VKSRTLGTVRLIAELYRKEVVKEAIIIVCLRELLEVRRAAQLLHGAVLLHGSRSRWLRRLLHAGLLLHGSLILYANRCSRWLAGGTISETVLFAWMMVHHGAACYAAWKL
jgi:hypothetical protein